LIQEPAVGYQDAAKHLEIWQECVAMWGNWLEYADRHALKRYCKLQLKVERGYASETEKRLCHTICVELGGTGGGRVRLGKTGIPSQPPGPELLDRRSQFLAIKKYG
jgi:hypothetical protein